MPTCHGPSHLLSTPAALTTPRRLSSLGVMACHSFKRTQVNPMYLPEILISFYAESLTRHAGGMGVSLTVQGHGPDCHALPYQSRRRTHALLNKPARLSLHCSSEIARPLSHEGRLISGGKDFHKFTTCSLKNYTSCTYVATAFKWCHANFIKTDFSS